jgi:hypothetical protein
MVEEIVRKVYSCTNTYFNLSNCANLYGTDITLVGWGFRSAYGIAFLPNDPTKLLVTVNGADERGSRPIANDTEKIYSIDIALSNSSQLGKFY